MAVRRFDSPDMALCVFWLYPRMKTLLKGYRFDSREVIIIQNATAQMHNIPKQAFKNCFQRSLRTTELSVWSHKGPILKEIRYCTPQMQNFGLPVQGQILFGQTSNSVWLQIRLILCAIRSGSEKEIYNVEFVTAHSEFESW
jgi:hypothetical protein